MKELEADIAIIGGGVGGVAAALSALSMGMRCVISEPTDWLGGQLTSQGVPPDENKWIETVGGTARYQRLRELVRASASAEGAGARAAEPFGSFNPGGGWVSRCCAEPVRWLSAIEEMLREVGGGDDKKLTRLMLHEPIGAEMDRDGVRAVTLRDVRSGECVIVRAKVFLDATETGDVLPLARAEYFVGAEHAEVYGELHGRRDFDFGQKKLDVLDQQACSWCFALEHRLGEYHTIEKPGSYEFWRSYAPGIDGGGVGMSPAWTGRLLSWLVPSHNEAGRREFRMVPWPDEPAEGEWEMWRYRRIVDASIWGGRKPDVSLINMVQMDYWQKPLLDVEPGERAAALRGAREQSLSLLYWMQTEAPRHDGKGLGYPGLKLRGEELGTIDGMAKAVYIREPRRLAALTVVHEGHVGTDQRKAAGLASPAMNWDATPYGTGERFGDSVGIGHYAIDLHPSCAGQNNVYVPSAPFRVPMGALVPRRVTNLLAAGKCLSVSHIVNGAYRMHHVEWNVGESAGVIAAMMVRDGLSGQAMAQSAQRVRAVQDEVTRQGVRIDWPWER